MKRHAFRLWFRLGVVTQGGVAGSKNLPAPVLFAGAARAGRVDRNVPKLARHPVPARDEMPICQDSRSDPFRNGDQYRIANTLHSSKPKLGHEAGGCGILYFGRQPHPALDYLLDVILRPLQVRSKNETLRFSVNAPRNADTNPFR